MMLDHRVDGNGLRTFEELGKHAYPSAPNESFQAIILGKIPSLGFKKSSRLCISSRNRAAGLPDVWVGAAEGDAVGDNKKI